MTTFLFDRLCTALSAEVDRNGRAHADCPFCGAAVKRKHIHFSFWQAGAKHARSGYKCFVCQRGGGLWDLAAYLELPEAQRPVETAQKATEERQPPRWQQNPEFYLSRYRKPLNLFEAWARYKPITAQSVGRFRLGLGKLPFVAGDGREFFGKFDRLIVPTFENGQCVGLEGRAIDPADDGPKWICATGTRKDVLFGAHLLRPGATVIIPENKVDCILAMQQRADVVAVTGGGSFWLEEWTALIVASQPARVIVWRDNDLVGQPNEWTRRQLIVDWRKKTAARLAEQEAKTGRVLPWPAEPVAIGPVIANQFLPFGVPTTLYQWPRSAPPKADLGWALTAHP